MAFYYYLPSLWHSLLLLLTSLIVYFFIYPSFLSPLSKLSIPNAHPLAKYTPFWILWRRLTHRENKTLHAAHQLLGPIVRVAPNEVSVNSLEGLRVIYGGNFDKHAWYANVFSNYFIDNTFCMTAAEPHRERKKMFANTYSKSYLQNSKDIHDNAQTLLFDRLLPIFQSASQESTGVELLELSAAIGMDWTCAFLFGLSAGSDFIRDADYRKHWLDTYDEVKSFFVYISEGFVIPLVLLNKIGLKFMPNSVLTTLDDMGKWNLAMCTKAQDPRFVSAEQTTRPIVLSQMTTGISKTPSSKHPTDLVIASETLDHILAGHETTAVTLTYLLWELSRHPDLQSALRTELSSLSPVRTPRDTHPIPLHYLPDMYWLPTASKTVSLTRVAQARPLTYKRNSHAFSRRYVSLANLVEQPLTFPHGPHSLPPSSLIDALPLLHALIYETLRRYPAASGSEPRVTPPRTTILHNYPLPGGVRISSNQYSLHREESVFPSPEEWRPSRWLDASPQEKTEMNRWFWAFGSGARMCLGVGFAMQGESSIMRSIFFLLGSSPFVRILDWNLIFDHHQSLVSISRWEPSETLPPLTPLPSGIIRNQARHRCDLHELLHNCPRRERSRHDAQGWLCGKAHQE